jgi:hypothetical protein
MITVGNGECFTIFLKICPWQRGLGVTSPPTTEEIGAMGHEIESRQSIGGCFKMFKAISTYFKQI